MLPRAPVPTNLKLDLLKEPRKYCDNLDVNVEKTKLKIFPTTAEKSFFVQMNVYKHLARNIQKSVSRAGLWSVRFSTN